MGTRPPVTDEWETVDDWEDVPENPLVGLRGQITAPAEQGAMRRSLAAPLEAAAARRNPEFTEEDLAQNLEGIDPRLGAASRAVDRNPEIMAASVALPSAYLGGRELIKAAVPTSVAALRRLALGTAGTAAGGAGGHVVGQGLEWAGAPEGTSEVTGAIGGFLGGGTGLLGGPKAGRAIAELAPGSVPGKILKWLSGEAPKKVAQARTAQAARTAMGGAAAEAGEGMAAKVAQARTAQAATKALSPEKQAILDASRAARGAKATETVAAARGGAMPEAGTRISGGTAGSWTQDDLVKSVGHMRAQGLSEDVIVESLRNVFGIVPKDAKQILKMIQ